MGPLGLHRRQGREPGEEHIIRRATARGPLGDGQVAMLVGASPQAVAQPLAVSLPARLAQLRINQLAGGGLVQVQLTSRFA